MPSAKMNELANGSFTTSMLSRKNAMPMHMAKTVTCLVRRFSSRVSGLSAASMFCVRLAILPNSVAMPMRKTTARPLPSDTLVPAKTRLGISAAESPLFEHGIGRLARRGGLAV